MDNKILEWVIGAIIGVFQGAFIFVGMALVLTTLYLHFFTKLIAVNPYIVGILIVASIGGLGVVLNTLFEAYCEVKELIKLWQK